MTLLLAVLSAYRLAQMIALEDGPFDLLAKWRELIGADKQSNWLQRGFSCPDCISFWTALFVALLLPITWPQFALNWLGIAGACLILNRITARLTYQ